jgi:transmembrane sensor
VNASRESAEEINQAAAVWAARADRGLTAEERNELSAWLSLDRRREGAYLRMSAVMAHTEGLAELRGEGRRGELQPARQTRRLWLLGGGAIAASIVGGLLIPKTVRPSEFDTRKGEKRVVTLADGSIVTLNTATRLQVSFSNTERLIRLVEGEALFDVAKDASRPFIVLAGDADVRAIGTSFTVTRRGSRAVDVLVREGVVEVTRPMEVQAVPIRVPANRRATVSGKETKIAVASVAPAEINRELAWREGRLVFAGESLASAADQFARYSDVRIVIAEPELAGRGVAGVFDAGDPVGFAQAAALSLDARAEILEGQVLIRR